MREFVADLHIHSCLSPCGSLDMSPERILREAKEKGINLIAITDHNYLEEGLYVAKLAPSFGIEVLYGMELQTKEEIHLLCYFNRAEQGLSFQEQVLSLLPEVDKCPEVFGDQVLVDEQENIIRVERKLLLNSVELDFQGAFRLVEEYGGIAVPAHIDRDCFSVLSQLGSLPAEVSYTFLEISWNADKEKVLEMLNRRDLPLVRFSDAHYPEEIGRAVTVFHMKEPTVEELVAACRGEGGRWFRA